MINLQDKEKVLYKGWPQPAVLFFWFFKSLLISLVIFWFFGIFGFTIFIPLASVFGVFSLAVIGIYALGFLFLFAIVFIYHIYLRKTYEYYATNQRVVFKGGLLYKRTRNVPYHKITDVEISQNIFEQILKIYTLRVHTAGMGGPMAEVRFIGLDDPREAEKIISKELKKFKGRTAD